MLVRYYDELHEVERIDFSDNTVLLTPRKEGERSFWIDVADVDWRDSGIEVSF
ncbi:hypothetical protein [Bacillus phage Hakuna]|uniref:Uncharacterized protein n=1 Tax=Bacillus phage Hakuna TaxID=1486659 RepID=A0A024B0R6_9CAUD|nr:hypothetical protein FP72_gp176 [Bacillus phage Hakuna]YP_009279352.1 hypothetical protein BIZ89_gp185 [Bacillus phage Kida]AHZ10194.1 hypothetical protein [Bacillus phage Hakuna]ANU79812.1 hypothetical protein KIDA_186 [Bacillus phage Kida]